MSIRTLLPACHAFVASLLLVLSGIAAAMAGAESTPAPEPIDSGSLTLRGADGAVLDAPRVDTAIQALVTGNLVRAYVTQNFVNPTDGWVEGHYAFPLSATAAVDELDMQVGERLIRGEIREKDAARAEFKRAADEGRRASLVEQQRPNLFTTAVANIPPHARIQIRIGYFDDVQFRDGGYRLHLPLAITPRYSPASTVATDDAPAVAAVTQQVAPRAQSASVTVELRGGAQFARVHSPSHQLRSSVQEDGARISLAEGRVPQDRDFELLWEPAFSPTTQAAAYTEGSEGGAFVLLSLLPPAATAATDLHREVIFIIDTSGSMQGPSIEQARASLSMALAALRPGDRFNVIRFSNDASGVFDRTAAVNPQTLQAARAFVGNLQADGGTEMKTALELALSMPADTELLRQMVFVTDGAVSNEQELMQLLRTRLGNTRLFTVGIGAAPNAYFMQEAAAVGHGTYTFIADGAQVRERMSALLQKLSQPALTGLALTWPNGAPAELAAALPADLYAGDPITVIARLAARVSGPVTLTGNGASGRWSQQIPLRPVPVTAGVSKLWARERIRSLERQFLAPEEAADLRAQVLPLALQHHLVSRYTSLIAVEQAPLRPAGDPVDAAAIPATPPAGSAWATTGFARTATPAPLWLAAALALLGAGLMLRFRRLRCRA